MYTSHGTGTGIIIPWGLYLLHNAERKKKIAK
jgi:hypothetical protein